MLDCLTTTLNVQIGGYSVLSTVNMILASCKYYSKGTVVSLIMRLVAKFMGSVVVVIVVCI